jgi:hypothetical protein
LRRRRFEHEEANISLARKGCAKFVQALEEELKHPLIRTGEVGRQTIHRHHRLRGVEGIGTGDGILECMIAFYTHVLLHPQQHKAPFFSHWLLVQKPHPFRLANSIRPQRALANIWVLKRPRT